MDNIILQLPWPPTVNNYYCRAGSRSGVFISTTGRKYRECVERAIMEQTSLLRGNVGKIDPAFVSIAHNRGESTIVGNYGLIYSYTKEYNANPAESSLIKLPTSAHLLCECTLYPPDKRTRDLDNYMKALLDAVTHSKAKVWIDDSQIDQLFIYRGEIMPKTGMVLLEITWAGPIKPKPKNLGQP